MAAPSIHERLARVRQWRRGGQRAPHKPLLLLLALGRAQRGASRLSPWEELRGPLEKLLLDFGPPRRSHNPQEPFKRLRNDGLWELTGVGDLSDTDRNALSSRQLLDRNVAGGLPLADYDHLRRNNDDIVQVAETILHAHFPPSYHDAICQTVGLDLKLTVEMPVAEEVHDRPVAPSNRRVRDPAFRVQVLRAYRRQCAVCGSSLRLGDALLDLQAAHIKWHAAGGPDEVRNGLALCGFHHMSFDRGALGLEADRSRYMIQVSEDVNGSGELLEGLLKFEGRRLSEPINRAQRPHPDFVDWHRQEVFHASA